MFHNFNELLPSIYEPCHEKTNNVVFEQVGHKPSCTAFLMTRLFCSVICLTVGFVLSFSFHLKLLFWDGFLSFERALHCDSIL